MLRYIDQTPTATIGSKVNSLYMAFLHPGMRSSDESAGEMMIADYPPPTLTESCSSRFPFTNPGKICRHSWVL
jgi:hypothetical protein